MMRILLCLKYFHFTIKCFSLVAPDHSLSVESHKDPLKIPSLMDPSLIFLNVTPIKNIQPAFLPPLNLKDPSKDDKDQRSMEPKDLKNIPPNSLYLPPVFHQDFDTNIIDDNKIGNMIFNLTNIPSFFSLLYAFKIFHYQSLKLIKLCLSCKLE